MGGVARASFFNQRKAFGGRVGGAASCKELPPFEREGEAHFSKFLICLLSWFPLSFYKKSRNVEEAEDGDSREEEEETAWAEADEKSIIEYAETEDEYPEEDGRVCDVVHDLCSQHEAAWTETETETDDVYEN